MTGGPPNAAYGAHQMAYAGIPSFMRRPATRLLEGVDVAVVGVPLDGGASSFRAGARLGPRKIREASLLLWGYHRALQVAPLERLSLVDYGDLETRQGDVEGTVRSVAAQVGVILSSGARVVALGGDHTITLPLLRAHAGRYGPLAVLHVDAHADTWPGPVDHATPFRLAAEEGLIDREAYVVAGLRGSLSGPDDLQAPARLGARVFACEDCLALGIPEVVRQARSAIGQRPLYVSIDLDAADPAFAPGVGTPEVAGLTSQHLLELVRGLRDLHLVGMDVVELCPPYDPAEITALLAATVVFEFLALLALQQRPHP